MCPVLLVEDLAASLPLQQSSHAHSVSPCKDIDRSTSKDVRGQRKGGIQVKEDKGWNGEEKVKKIQEIKIQMDKNRLDKNQMENKQERKDPKRTNVLQELQHSVLTPTLSASKNLQRNDSQKMTQSAFSKLDHHRSVARNTSSGNIEEGKRESEEKKNTNMAIELGKEKKKNVKFVPTIPQEFKLKTQMKQTEKSKTSEEMVLEKAKMEVEKNKDMARLKSARLSMKLNIPNAPPVTDLPSINSSRFADQLNVGVSNCEEIKSAAKPAVEKPKVTKPISPKLTARKQRPLPPSSEEIEMERVRAELEAIHRQHKNALEEIAKVKEERHVLKKFEKTVPQEFNFHYRPRLSSVNDNIDLEVVELDESIAPLSNPKPIQAWKDEYVPLSNAIQNTFNLLRSSDFDLSSKPVGPTKIEEFHFHVDSRRQPGTKELTTDEKVEMEMKQYKFQAKPVDPALYQPPAPAILSVIKPTVPLSPKFATDERLGKAEPDSASKIDEKRPNPNFSQLYSAQPVPTEVIPFQLTSEIRGMMKQAKLAQQIKDKEDEEAALRCFHAKEFVDSEISLQNIALNRAARMSIDARKKLAAKEQEVGEFRALPLPQTHIKPFLLKQVEKKPIEVVPFALSTADTERALKRAEIEKRSIQFELEKKKQEVERKRKEDEDFQKEFELHKFRARPYVRPGHTSGFKSSKAELIVGKSNDSSEVQPTN